MSELSISNVINISVATPQPGVGQYNTSNLAIFSSDTPGGDFGDLGYKIYLEPTEVATDFGTSSDTYKMANAVFSQQPNILLGGGYLVVIPFLAMETLAAAITRTVGLVQYFGIMMSGIPSQSDMLAAAAVVQALNKIAFFVSNNSAAVNDGGYLDLIQSGGFTKSRGLLYILDVDTTDSLVMMAAYAGLALSTNFNGSNTTQTMDLKTLSGVLADSSMTQTIQDLATAAGADTYPSIQGVAKVLCSGENDFFDNVYNLGWFVGALQVAGFNALAQVNTKIPQTENGMNILKGAYRAVCEQAVTNQFVAAGTWTSAVTFGNQVNFLQNIVQRGYYIYSVPISQQLPAVRVTRAAPLVQIAIKYAGAMQTSSVVVNVNP